MATPKIQLVIYDLDGTLIDSVPDLCHALCTMLSDMQLEGVAVTEVQQWIGNGSLKLVERALHARGGSDTQLPEAHHLFLAHYRAHLHTPSPMYDGVKSTLTTLWQKGIAQAVATNKPQQFVPVLLNQLGIAHTIGAIVGGNTYATKKPDALPLTALLNRFQCPASHALMIGDSRSDALSAKAANIRCWLLEQGYSQGENLHALGAEHVFATFNDMVPELLRGITH